MLLQEKPAMIPRLLHNPIKKTLLERRKIVILYGPRQTGKTTLIQSILQELPHKTLHLDADFNEVKEVFSHHSLRKMLEVIGNHELLFLDEAQNIPDIGINLKILHDHLPKLKIIATGSSSFELANRIQEPLTGRTRTYRLYPISMGELRLMHTPFELKQQVETYMLYGLYPEVLNLQGSREKINHLKELSSAYLYKDILQLVSLKHSDKIYKLLQLLAYQIGSLVSLEELGKSLNMDRKTVEHYVDLLEKSFILFRLSGFSRNPRKEISKRGKIYFYDLGIRNALINHFAPIHLRSDAGFLWENFLIAERLKKRSYEQHHSRFHFWRTYFGTKIDLVEEYDGQAHGFEFKWKKRGRKKAPPSWSSSYPTASYQIIDKDNFLEFILKRK